MKRFSLFIKRLSLSQQLFALIFFFVTFFAAFFFVYLSGKVDMIIEAQMNSTLLTKQSTIISSLQNGTNINQFVEAYSNDSTVTNIFFMDYKIYANKEVDQESGLFRDISAKLPYASGKAMTYTYSGNPKTYYSIVRVSDTITLASYTKSDYMEEFKGALVSSVINITVIVVGFFFIILMIWVAGLIHPLNQMRNYIDKVKLGMDADLKVNREDEIGELADALVSMRTELKRQERTKEDMIQNISHDLKTPIATIKSYGESIKDGIYPYDTLEKSVDVIIDNADRLEKKVYSLLFMNRVEYLISQDSEGACTSMKDVIEAVILNIKVIRPDIVIDTDLDEVFFNGLEEPWMVTVENIIENALRYAKSKIEIHLHENEGLSIYNDGPCIAEDRLDVLFKPYEKGQGGKFGLGLSIVAKVVNANRYEVSGENTSDGVIFRINKRKE